MAQASEKYTWYPVLAFLISHRCIYILLAKQLSFTSINKRSRWCMSPCKLPRILNKPKSVQMIHDELCWFSTSSLSLFFNKCVKQASEIHTWADLFAVADLSSISASSGESYWVQQRLAWYSCPSIRWLVWRNIENISFYLASPSNNVASILSDLLIHVSLLLL